MILTHESSGWDLLYWEIQSDTKRGGLSQRMCMLYLIYTGVGTMPESVGLMEVVKLVEMIPLWTSILTCRVRCSYNNSVTKGQL
jgi:hypothetical protein